MPLYQLRPTRGPDKVFAVVKYPTYWQLVLILIILNLIFLLQVILSATLSRLLPLQLGLECFQYISLS